MLLEGDRGRSFELDGTQCTIREQDGHAVFEAVTSTFGVALIYPGWYRGAASTQPVHIAIEGDLFEASTWLPVSPDKKRSIIKQLSIGIDDEVLLFLLV